MDHGGEAARPTTVVESTELVMAGAVHGGEAHIRTGTYDSQLLHRDIFNGQFGAAAARRGSFDNSAVYHNSAEFARHVRTAAGRGELFVAEFYGEPGPGVVHANVGDFWRQPGPGDEVLVAGLQLPDPDGVVPVPVHDNYGYYQLQPRPGAGSGEVHVHLLPDGVSEAYDHYAYPGVGRGEVLVNLLHHGVGVVYDNHAWQFRPGAGRGEVIANLLIDAAGAVYGPGNFAQETLPGTGRAEGNLGALRGPSISAGYDGMVGEYLRRLLAFIGIGACYVAVNGLAAGPGSPAVAFHLFALHLGGLFLVILHVLRV